MPPYVAFNLIAMPQSCTNLCQLHYLSLGNASNHVSHLVEKFYLPYVARIFSILPSLYPTLCSFAIKPAHSLNFNFSCCNFKALLTVCISLASRVADRNSNLAIIYFFRGATLDFSRYQYCLYFILSPVQNIDYSRARFIDGVCKVMLIMIFYHGCHNSGFCADTDQSQ